jgi:hypothetical protein
MDVDLEKFKERYPAATNKYFYCSYLNGGSPDLLGQLLRKEGAELRIQINNSCDISTLEVLDLLAPFKNENIEINTIVSYGQTKYKDEIIAKGKALFKDKFKIIDTYLPQDAYFQHLADNDILILYQNRQQGFGNILASLFMEKKVYVRSDVTTFNFLKQENIHICDSFSLKDMSFQDLISYPEEKRKYNKEAVKAHFYDENAIKRGWQLIFDDD